VTKAIYKREHKDVTSSGAGSEAEGRAGIYFNGRFRKGDKKELDL
tara:strand:+ start:258 stop:392 length:135 start_codon:yes stop_codon:yes gene_type:complete